MNTTDHSLGADNQSMSFNRKAIELWNAKWKHVVANIMFFVGAEPLFLICVNLLIYQSNVHAHVHLTDLIFHFSWILRVVHLLIRKSASARGWPHHPSTDIWFQTGQEWSHCSIKTRKLDAPNDNGGILRGRLHGIFFRQKPDSTDSSRFKR